MLKVQDSVVINNSTRIEVRNILQHKNLISGDTTIKLRIYTDDNLTKFTDVDPTEVTNIGGNLLPVPSKPNISGDSITKYNDLTLVFPISTVGILKSKVIISSQGRNLETNLFIVNNSTGTTTIEVPTITKDYDIEYVGVRLDTNKITSGDIQIQVFANVGKGFVEMTNSYNNEELFKLPNSSQSVNVKVTIKKIKPCSIRVSRIKVFTN